MPIRVALHHRTEYKYDRLTELGPQVVRLRPAPHCRTPIRAYCDMTLPGELCTEVQEEHRGRTHEGSRLDFLMQSVLVPEKGVCSIWALRTALDGKPFFPADCLANKYRDRAPSMCIV